MGSSVFDDCHNLLSEINAAAQKARSANAKSCQTLAQRVALLESLLPALQSARDQREANLCVDLDKSMEVLKRELQNQLRLMKRCAGMGDVYSTLTAGETAASFKLSMLALRHTLQGLLKLRSAKVTLGVLHISSELEAASFEPPAIAKSAVADLRRKGELLRAGKSTPEETSALLLESLQSCLPNGLGLQQCKAELCDLESALAARRWEKDGLKESLLQQLIAALQLQASSMMPNQAPGTPNQAPMGAEAEADGKELDGPSPPPLQFLCPISKCLMAEPVVLVETGVMYELDSIMQWFDRGNATCPVTGRQISNRQLAPDHEVQATIAAWAEERGMPVAKTPAEPPSSARSPVDLAMSQRAWENDRGMPVSTTSIGPPRSPDCVADSAKPRGALTELSNKVVGRGRRTVTFAPDEATLIQSSSSWEEDQLKAWRVEPDRSPLKVEPDRSPPKKEQQPSNGGVVGLEGGRGLQADFEDGEARARLLCEDLQIAALAGSSVAVNKLLLYGADIECRGDNERTPLLHAASRGHLSVVRLLLHKGASAAATDADGCTPLHVAACEGHSAVAAELVRYPAVDVNAVDSTGYCALHWAVGDNRPEVAKVLLGAGADATVVSEGGLTALHLAAIVGCPELTGALLSHGADAQAKAHTGWTPLHFAAACGNVACAELLVAAGADVHAVDASGKRAEEVAGTLLHLKMTAGSSLAPEPAAGNSSRTSLGEGGWAIVGSDEQPLDYDGSHLPQPTPGAGPSGSSRSRARRSSSLENGHPSRSQKSRSFDGPPMLHETNGRLPAVPENYESIAIPTMLSAPLPSTGRAKLDQQFEELLSPYCTSTVLDMSWMGLDTDGTRAFAVMLARNTCLHTVQFRGNNPGPEGARYIAWALQQNTTLLYLSLMHCNVGGEGAAALAEALRSNSSLQTLKLFNAGIGSEIGRDDRQEFIDISSPPLGALALVESLQHNRTLRHLGMGSNLLGPELGMAFASALRVNTALEVLDLRSNRLGEPGVAAIAEACEQNDTLRKLKLGGNDLPFFMPKRIKHIFAERKKTVGLRVTLT